MKLIAKDPNISANPLARKMNIFHFISFFIRRVIREEVDGISMFCEPSPLPWESFIIISPFESHVARTVNFPGCRHFQITFASPLMKPILDTFSNAKIAKDKRHRNHEE